MMILFVDTYCANSGNYSTSPVICHFTNNSVCFDVTVSGYGCTKKSLNLSEVLNNMASILKCVQSHGSFGFCLKFTLFSKNAHLHNDINEQYWIAHYKFIRWSDSNTILHYLIILCSFCKIWYVKCKNFPMFCICRLAIFYKLSWMKLTPFC